MCDLKLLDSCSAERGYYSGHKEGYIGGAVAYYNDEHSFNYAIDIEVVRNDEVFIGMHELLDMLQLDFPNCNSMLTECKKSRRRLFVKNAVTPEYGFCYQNKKYKYFVRVNPEYFTNFFKIFVYPKEVTL